MMGNFFNRMYNGNSGKGDYTKDDLPGNRWQLFLAMVRLNFGKLIQANLIFVVFFLPMFIWLVINIQVFAAAYESGGMDELLGYFTIFIFGAAPCLVILSPAVAGMTYITRNMARDQNVWIWSDFWYAVKQNIKPTLALGAINGVALIVGYLLLIFYQGMSSQGVLYMLMHYFVIALAALWICMNCYLWPMMVTYELSVRQLIKNSFIMAVGRLPQTLFMLVFSLLPPALVFLVFMNSIAMLVGVVVYLLIGFSLTGLGINSVTNSIFDKFINVRIKGARVNQGLRIEFDRDDEEDGEDDGGEGGEGDGA